MYVNMILGIPEKAAAMISEGAARRVGGVVREYGSERIVAFLEDTDPSLGDLVTANVVPLAVMGISVAVITRRLKKIEASIQELKSMLDALAAEVKLQNLKVDAQLIGRLRGSLHAYQLDLARGEIRRLSEYRHGFLESYHQFRHVVADLVKDAAALRRYEPVLRQYVRAMCVAGVAARDASYRMDDRAGTVQCAEQLAGDVATIESLAHEQVSKPPALFWRQDGHVEFVLEVRESAARLQSHVDALKLLPRDDIDRLVARQAVA